MKEVSVPTAPSETELAAAGKKMEGNLFPVLSGYPPFTEAFDGDGKLSEVMFDSIDGIMQNVTFFKGKDGKEYAFCPGFHTIDHNDLGFLLAVVSIVPGQKLIKVNKGVMFKRVSTDCNIVGTLKFLSGGKITTDTREALEESKRFIAESIVNFKV